MLHTILFENTNEIFDLSNLDIELDELTVICPGPEYADNFRKQLGGRYKVNVITISKFVKDELYKVSKDLEVISKSKLLVHLSIIFKKYYHEQDDEIYFSSFKLFTELRSYTLNLEDMMSILEDFDQEVVEVIIKFWQYLEISELIDEQKSYSILSENYLDNKESLNPSSYMFYGFNHMNSQQIDLLKNLANKDQTQVYIPFPEEVYSASRSSDWVSWLDADDLESNNNQIMMENIPEELSTCQYISFTKGRIAKALSFYKDNICTPDNNKFDILLGQKNLSIKEINSIPFDDFFFKTPSHFFISIMRDTFEKIKNLYMGKASIETKILVDFLDEELEKRFKEVPEKREFRTIKLLLMLRKYFLDLLEMSDENKKLSTFDIKVIEQVVELDLPRVFTVPVVNEDDFSHIRGTQNIQAVDLKKNNIFCLTSSYVGLKGGEGQYNEKTSKALSVLGPIQRPEFDFQILKFYLKEIIANPSTVVFLEEGLIDQNQKIKEIFNDFNMRDLECDYLPSKEIECHYQVENDKSNQGLINNTSIISAGKLQTYIDCPLKYYYSYIDKIQLNITSKEQIRSDQLGILEHKLIEDYMNENKFYDEKKHFDLSIKVLDEFIEQGTIMLSEFEYSKILLEISKYSANGIKFLESLLKEDPSCRLIFEYDLSELDPSVSGRVDCIAVSDSGVGIIDFKRSSFSIPSIKDLTQMKKIQIWFYLSKLEHKFGLPAFFGFINLSEISSSRIFCEEYDLSFRQIKTSKIKAGFAQVLNEFNTFHDDILMKLNLDKQFLPNPRTTSVCTFCKVAMICPRGDKS